MAEPRSTREQTRRIPRIKGMDYQWRTVEPEWRRSSQNDEKARMRCASGLVKWGLVEAPGSVTLVAAIPAVIHAVHE